MAQIIPQINSLQASQGLYVSLERETAIAEFENSGSPLGANDIVYTIKSLGKDGLRLINFDAAVAHIDQQLPMVGVARVVSETPYYGAWKYQKHPKLTQIIGVWLIASLYCSASKESSSW